MKTINLEQIVAEELVRNKNNSRRCALLRRFDATPRGHYFACDQDRDAVLAVKATRTAEQIDDERYAGLARAVGDSVTTPVANAMASIYDELIYNLAVIRERGLVVPPSRADD